MKTANTLIKMFIVTIVSCAAAFAQVEERPAEERKCPVISVTGPGAVSRPGQEMLYTAEIGQEIEQYDVEYVWSISAGKIISGQGTKAVVVADEKGLNITVTIEVKGLPEGCPNMASESGSPGCGGTLPIKTDEITGFDISDLEERLENFFLELSNDPSSTAVVAFPNNKKDTLKNIRYLSDRIRAGKIESDRIIVVAGKTESGMIEFWRIPAGATSPEFDNALIVKIEDLDKLHKSVKPKAVKPKTKK